MSTWWGWRLAALSVCGAVLVTPVWSWLRSVGSLADYFRYALPPGQVLYVLSKLAGLVAFSLFWLQGLLALARGTPLAKGLPRVAYMAHRNLGLAVIAAALLHFGLFFAASSLRAGVPAWGLWLPRLTHGYYPLYLGLGLIALWLLALGAFAGWRRRRGASQWHWAHRVWFAAFVLVSLHGLAIGSESRAGVMRYVFLFIVASLVLAALYRTHHTLKARGGRPLEGLVRRRIHGAPE